LIAHYWDAIKGGASAAVGWIKGVWNSFVGFFTGLGSSIASATAGMFHGITDAFRAALNALIDLWNRMHFTIGGWGVGPVHVPTVDVGLPTIPHLQSGGIITATGLVLAHAGEAITPMPRGRLGPAIAIEHAHFTDPVDIDVLWQRTEAQMRRAV